MAQDFSIKIGEKKDSRRRQVMNVEKNLPTFISQLIHLWQNFEYSPLGTRMQKH